MKLHALQGYKSPCILGSLVSTGSETGSDTAGSHTGSDIYGDTASRASHSRALQYSFSHSYYRFIFFGYFTVDRVDIQNLLINL